MTKSTFLTTLAETLFSNFYFAMQGFSSHRKAIENIANTDLEKHKSTGVVNLVKCARRMVETLDQVDRGEKPRDMLEKMR